MSHLHKVTLCVMFLTCLLAAPASCSVTVAANAPISHTGRVKILLMLDDGFGEPERDAVRSAAERWHYASGGAVTWVETHYSGAALLSASHDAETIAVLVIPTTSDDPVVRRNGGNTVIGVASYRRVAGRHVYTTIRLVMNKIGHSEQLIYRVAVHELGHALGIYEHLPTPVFDPEADWITRKPIMAANDSSDQCITRADLSALCDSISCTLNCSMRPCDGFAPGQCR